MLQVLSNYKKSIAYPLFALFYLQIIVSPLHAAVNFKGSYSGLHKEINRSFNMPAPQVKTTIINENEPRIIKTGPAGELIEHDPSKEEIGGPSSPEASSFKAVGSDNLVNLFTGDFSYSIPLLDVGGYPVNLFYNGGISMEQEASWVGLGWNINPGTVNRNMRGVPDDFNGEDELIQTQKVKPNRTWGGEVGVDGEALGIKAPNVNFSLGFSYNNYLGPALELGAGISVSVPLTESAKSEKGVASADSSGFGNPASASLGVGAKLNSRSGLTFSPSLNLSTPINDKKANIGIGLSTSYNSRTGIKDLNISSQMSTSRFVKDKETGFYNSGNRSSMSASLASSSISFARPTYMPALRMPMEFSNFSGQLELGVGMFGLRGSGHAQGYYSISQVPEEWQVVHKPLVGYIYSENANDNKHAVMDFNRLNDAEVTPRTPVISAPQYAYDVFSIQGEGTGGSIRAYRGDMGFMRDNVTTSKDKNISIGFDIAPPGHYGGNWNIVHTPTKVGGWEDNNNTLKRTIGFRSPSANDRFENVYFRNPGEVTVVNPDIVSRIGADNLVRFKISGSKINPRLESTLEQFNKKTLSVKSELPVASTALLTNRDKRTQVTTFLTAADASVVGLDKQISNCNNSFDENNNIIGTQVSRVGEHRRAHHISEIDVLEQSGMRYVYGLPVYSLLQKDYTFSVSNIGDAASGLVNFSTQEPGAGSPHMSNGSKIDGYLMNQETPAYASAFLLTGLLSPDYVDVNGDGITEDDLGSAVKFNYGKSGKHRWMTPRSETNGGRTAHFNEGLKSEKKDNKATVSYGEREVWYLSSIESKSMIAIFTTEWRDDAKGVQGELDGRIKADEDVNKRLKQIDLYTKAEIKQKGIANAKPIKTVHFEYSYALCTGTPDNVNQQGKLTLKSVYFSYNKQSRQHKNKYVFDYGEISSEPGNPAKEAEKKANNPDYARNASDKWGTYKNPDINPSTNAGANPAGLVNADYPYTSFNKPANDAFAAAWSMKKILLPSGGQMEISYEADDYAYVQDRRACDMRSIYGLGNSTAAAANPALYNNGISTEDNFYVYVKLPEPLLNTNSAKQKQEIFDKYLQTLNQLAFKLIIQMKKGPEALTIYAQYDDWGLCSNSINKDIIYLKLKPVDGKSPLSTSAIGFLTENLPGQAFDGYEIEVGGIAAFLEMVGGLMAGLKGAFKNVDNQMRSLGRARIIELDKSFVRLANPWKTKYGGGSRVKRVVVRDNWKAMKGKYTSAYGQDYDYTTTEIVDGNEKIISSGVASYEPGIGSEENPFREIIAFSNKMPLASAQYGAIEMPALEGFYPAPGVGYSKVTVRSIHRKGTHGTQAVRSGIGKQVTEFYTAKEYPVFSTFTPAKGMEYHYNSFFNLLYKEITDRKVMSQGFLVETNDMHGKMKSQTAYSESDEKTPLSYSLHKYKNTGKNGFNDKVDFVHNELGGTVVQGNMGIDMELMTDVREFKIETNGFNGQIQSDFFTFVPWPIFVVPMLPIKTYTENRYRAVTCTKLINYHAIEEEVIVMDKGSVISTKTIAYDAETGSAIVTKTANEFNDPIYNVSYPAHWAYSGLGLAYQNIDRRFSGAGFNEGVLTIPGMTAQNISDIFESGDELYVTAQSDLTGANCINSANVTKLWAYDKNKNNTALTVPVKDLVFIDAKGRLFSKANVSFRIIRSGKRNLLGTSLASASVMVNPVASGTLTVNANSKVVTASAIEYKEKWQTDKDVIKRFKETPNQSTCVFEENEDCDGYLDKKINPYLKGLIGNFKAYRNYVFYGSRAENDASTATAIRSNGFIANFATFWNFNSYNNMVPDYSNSQWVWNSEVKRINAKGQELETKDALERYTAAQYGFAKNMPVAVSQNARYGESFAETFEDAFFKGSLHNESTPCENSKYISFASGTTGTSYIVHEDKPILSSGFSDELTCATYFVHNNGGPNGAINVGEHGFVIEGISTGTSPAYEAMFAPGNVIVIQDNVGSNSQTATVISSELVGNGNPYTMKVITSGTFIHLYSNTKVKRLITTYAQAIKAHTGEYVLDIPANSTVIKNIPVDTTIKDTFYVNNFSVDSVGTYSRDNVGGIVEKYNGPGTNGIFQTYLSSNIDGGIQWIVTPYINSCTHDDQFNYNYRLETSQYFEVPHDGRFYFLLANSSGYPAEGESEIIGTSVQDASGQQVPLNLTSTQHPSAAVTWRWYQGCFKKGIYKLFITVYSNYSYTCSITPHAAYCMCTGSDQIALVTDQFYFQEYDASVGAPPTIPTANPIRFGTGFTMNEPKCFFKTPIHGTEDMLNPSFTMNPDKKMHFSAWIKEDCPATCTKTDYTLSNIEIASNGSGITGSTVARTGPIIDGWQKVEGDFTLPANATNAQVRFINNNSAPMYVDDIRIHPFNSNIKSYAYDPQSLRLVAELDENNYASFYEYDAEGQLVRVKKETLQGIKTINESRSANQKAITTIQTGN